MTRLSRPSYLLADVLICIRGTVYFVICMLFSSHKTSMSVCRVSPTTVILSPRVTMKKGVTRVSVTPVTLALALLAAVGTILVNMSLCHFSYSTCSLCHFSYTTYSLCHFSYSTCSLCHFSYTTCGLYHFPVAYAIFHILLPCPVSNLVGLYYWTLRENYHLSYTTCL